MKKPCKELFMAGTACSDLAGHEGPHSALCLDCGGDWVIGTCTCMYYCAFCDDQVVSLSGETYTVVEDDSRYAVCGDCFRGHPSQEELSPADMSYVLESLGVR